MDANGLGIWRVDLRAVGTPCPTLLQTLQQAAVAEVAFLFFDGRADGTALADEQNQAAAAGDAGAGVAARDSDVCYECNDARSAI